MSQPGLSNVQGNHACALGAVAAGCKFFAGYPITPSSEVAERMAAELPGVDGVFIQMEDEIASMGAVVGASMGGAKSMTATSGPGFSLKQENLGYAAQAEIPCVVINVMRGGPSTGMPTRPSQGDIMQARWGTHGDHPIIVVAPASVKEIFSETVRAFNLSERLRVPVIVLYDEVIGHLVESVDLQTPSPDALSTRAWADGPKADYQPYAVTDDLVPPMARPGDGYRVHTTGLTHDETGFPTQDPATAAQSTMRLLDKLEHHRDLIDSSESLHCDDAEIVVVAIGICARATATAVAALRDKGVKAGLFRPITLWPFPERAYTEATANAKAVLVPEMNAGQMILEVQRISRGGLDIHGLNAVDGEAIEPARIVEHVEELAR